MSSGPPTGMPSGAGMPAGIDPGMMAASEKALGQSRTLLACVAAVYVWEWLICLPQEYRLIWRARPNSLNVVFLLLRYLTFIEIGLENWLFNFTSSNDACRKAIWVDPILPIILFVLADYIVISRVYGMWERSKVVLAVLCTFLVAQIAIHGYLARRTDGMIPPGVGACVPTLEAQTTRIYWLYWGMPMVFDVLVLVFSLVKLAQLWRNGGRSRLIFVLLRDQIVFYVLCFIVAILNIIVYYAQLAPGAKGRGVMEPVVVSIQSIAVCRVVLNVREAAIEGVSSAALPSGTGRSTHQSSIAHSPRVIRSATYATPKANAFEMHTKASQADTKVDPARSSSDLSF